MSNAITLTPFSTGGGSGNINVATAVEKNNHLPVESDAVYRYIADKSATFGRFWNESNSTPEAAGYFGSVDFGQNLAKYLGLGRYLVTDDLRFTKLNPTNSYQDVDGNAVLLDGTMGQCMWCWNEFYYGNWEEVINGNTYTYECISFLPTYEGHHLQKIPAGGVSWLGAGVWDGETNKLCSLISNDNRYRGGSGSELSLETYTQLSADMSQRTMLGMPRTNKSTTAFGEAARLRGAGWEANWFVAEAVVEILIRIHFGNRNVQTAYSNLTDLNFLKRGGLGAGVSNMPDWTSYNGISPLIPNEFSVEDGDGSPIGDYIGVKEYGIKNSNDTVIYRAPVPFFYGLMNPYGHLFKIVRGLIIDIEADGESKIYVAKSMLAPYNPVEVNGKLLAGQMSRDAGYIKKLVMNRMAMLPNDTTGSSITYYGDYLNTSPSTSNGLMVRLAGGAAAYGSYAGSACSNTYNSASNANAYLSAPLCVFSQDPTVD